MEATDRRRRTPVEVNASVDERTVLVLDDESSFRDLLRIGLELEGFRVIEAATLAQTRAVLGESFDAIVLDQQVGDGNGLELVEELRHVVPGARIILHSNEEIEETCEAIDLRDGLTVVDKGDVAGVVEALAQRRVSTAAAERTVEPEIHHPGSVAVRRGATAIVELWRLLCQWDPSLPPDADPPIAESVVAALAEAMDRPQPLGWGLDPALDAVAQAFALNATEITVALAQLVCLREACERIVVAETSPEIRDEVRRRQSMVIDRVMLGVGEIAVRRLAEQAESDPLTGLGNRRAFDNDLRRHVAIARRHGTPLSVVVLDVDGLKAVNDRDGHAAGDDLLRDVASALNLVVRAEDGAFRVGGDEFALLFAGSSEVDVDRLQRRLFEAGCPPVSIGAASTPGDPPGALVELADRRLYESRRRRISPAS